MGCTSCGSGSGGSCSSGCGKLDVNDWLGDMSRPLSPFDAVEVRFKGGRKQIFRNVHNLELYSGDVVVTEAASGHHIGEVTMQGEIVRLQLKKKRIAYNDDLPIIYRKCTEKDIEKFEQARNRELPTLYRSREIIQRLQLKMKLSDIEFQADNSKATFYYSAEERVDFRELIKQLANEFKVRVEMKQISLRQEASRLGGIGSCGRELCCSTWLTNFKNVSTSAARYQNLSLNPAKLSGQCGRLKCCLNYELDTYLTALRDIPKVEKPLKTEIGLAFHQKTDIFKRLMWFSYEKDTNFIALTIDRVEEILEINKRGEKVYTLEDNEEEIIEETDINSDLQALDRKLNRKNHPNKRSKKRKNTRNSNSVQAKSNQNNKNNKNQNKQKPNRTKSNSENKPVKKKSNVQNKTNNSIQSKVKDENTNKRKSTPKKQVNKPDSDTSHKQRQNVTSKKSNSEAPIEKKKFNRPKRQNVQSNKPNRNN